MASIPNFTLVTGCYLLTKYYANSIPSEKLLKSIEAVLSVPCYLVIYCNSPLEEHIRNTRNKYNLSSLTKIIVTEIEDLWAYKFINKIKENKEKYWPTHDTRISDESMVLVFNKFNFVLKTIMTNPFNTEKFGWIDSNLEENGRKICDYDFNRLLMYNIKNAPEKFHLQILNVEDKKYKQPEFKKEYYSRARWVAMGGLFTTPKEIGIKILSRLHEIIKNTIEAGYGHGEEYFYLEILDEFYDDIYRAYGDYKQALHNFLLPIKNHNYIYWNIIMNYLHKGYYKECRDASYKMLQVFDDNLVDMNYDMYIRILSALLNSLQFLNSEEYEFTKYKFKTYYKSNPLFKSTYDILKYHIGMTNFDIE